MTVRIWLILDVPYSKKEDAKENAKLRWDPNAKHWYTKIEFSNLIQAKEFIDSNEELSISYYAYGYRLKSIQELYDYFTDEDLRKLTLKFTKSRNIFIETEKKKKKDQEEKDRQDKAKHELGLCLNCDNRIFKDMWLCIDCDY